MEQPRNTKGQWKSQPEALKNPGRKAPVSFTPVANPAYAQAMAELRRSNAAGTHADRRTRRARTRADAKRRALQDRDD
jgi:hypothetical protein